MYTVHSRARICRPFKEPRNRFPAWRVGTQPYLSYRPARLHRLEKSIPRNRFLDSIIVYKYGLCSVRQKAFARSRFHERTISLRFLNIILRVIRLEVYVCLHYKPVSNHFCTRGRGRWPWIARRKTLKTFVPIKSQNSASELILLDKPWPATHVELAG